MKKCEHCLNDFVWNQDVIVCNDKFYHKDCVTLYPSSYVVYCGDEFLGESENDEGEMAFEVLEEGEYEDND